MECLILDLKTKFKQTEIRRIPDDWKIKTIGDIAELYRENFTPINDDIRPYIGLEHIGQGTLDLVGIGSSLDVKSNKLIFEKGNILFGKLRPYFKKVVLANFDGICSTDIFVIRPKNLDYYNKFIFYLFASDILVNLATSASEGTKMPRASWNFLKKQTFAIPPYHEQQQIGDALNSLDQKISLNRQMNTTLEAIGQAIFKHWFVDFEFPNEDGKPYRSSGGEMVDSELGAVPEGWEVTSIGDVVKVVGGGTPSTKNPAFWEGGTHHWTTPKDLSNISSPVLLDTARKITDAGLAKISSRLLPTGTFLLSSRAPVGYTAIAQVPLAVNQGYIAIPPTERLSSLFLLHWTRVNLETIKGRACGTTFQEISKKNFRPIKIAVPTPEILTRFDITVGHLFERIVANERESRALTSIRDALLPKLMSGEICVKCWKRD